ncbi:hypothetical protein EVJ58_g3736, partial [Rhodofomes roseus]
PGHLGGTPSANKADLENAAKVHDAIRNVPEAKILEYRDYVFSGKPLFEPIESYTAANAASWLNLESFKKWYLKSIQDVVMHSSPSMHYTARATPLTHTPASPSRSASLTTPVRSIAALRAPSDRNTGPHTLIRGLQTTSLRRQFHDTSLPPSSPYWSSDASSEDLFGNARASLHDSVPRLPGRKQHASPALRTNSLGTTIRASHLPHHASSEVIEISDDDNAPTPHTPITQRATKPLPTNKRKHVEVKKEDFSDLSDVEIVHATPSRDRPVKKAKVKPTEQPGAFASARGSRTQATIQVLQGKKGKGKSRAVHSITRQMAVDTIIDLDVIPRTWTVPEAEGQVAYRLDLTDDARDWVDGNGDLMTMATIIKSQDLDSWGGGTGGSRKKLVNVPVLGDVLCRYVHHKCQGMWHCDHVPSYLLDGFERFEPDTDDRREFWDLERQANATQGTSAVFKAASFYLEMESDQCPADRGMCSGVAVYRRFKNMERNFDGKKGFIGCPHYKETANGKHRFKTIPRDVNEDILLELFQYSGTLQAAAHDELVLKTAECGFMVPPRSGAKGEKICHLVHLVKGKEPGTSVPEQGCLVHRSCDTEISIWFPDDLTDRRAIVYIKRPHNHPTSAPTKLSRDAHDQYEAAIEAYGTDNLTVAKVDRAQSTKDLLGQIPSHFDPSLGITRHKRKLVATVKQRAAPHGNGIEGVMAYYSMDQQKPKDERYVHSVNATDGINLIITMNPVLARRLHDVLYSLHDNTYKRVSGSWKEWEATYWDEILNMRMSQTMAQLPTDSLALTGVTYARIYCTHETEDAFHQMWTGLWNTIERITGKPVKFKFLHGEGLRAIVVDGSKPQAIGCGLDLISRNDSEKTGIQVDDPKIIIQYVLKTCSVHLDRNLDELARKGCPEDVMKRIRGFPYLETEPELEEFIKWCEASPHKPVRDWISDKKPHPWYWAALNRNFSRMPGEDWDTTASDTNLNESAHPFTNQSTGINRPILEAIKSARTLDEQVAAKITQSEEQMVMWKHDSTLRHRLRRNINRRDNKAAKAAAQHAASDELSKLNEEYDAAEDVRKACQEALKTLREEKKALRGQTAEDAKGRVKALDVEIADHGARLKAAQVTKKDLSKQIKTLKEQTGINRKSNPARKKGVLYEEAIAPDNDGEPCLSPSQEGTGDTVSVTGITGPSITVPETSTALETLEQFPFHGASDPNFFIAANQAYGLEKILKLKYQ